MDLEAPKRSDHPLAFMALSIILLNTNGIRNSDKRAGLLQSQMLCLQDTHCVSGAECQSWFCSSGFLVVSPGSQKSCGCYSLLSLFVPSLILV